MHYKKLIVLGLVLVSLSLVFAACSKTTETGKPAPVVEPTRAPCPKVECPEAQSCPTAEPLACPEPVVKDVPNQDAWAASPHNNTEAEAFNHWNEDDPKAVPATCAKCHSTAGYIDYLGADGTAALKVDNPAPIGSTITCQACHNAQTSALSSVTFHSGEVVNGLDSSARCMICHQGMASKVSVDKAVTDSGVSDADTVSDKLSFINIHYFAAAVTLYGTGAKGGYEYDGKGYDYKNFHVEGFNTCVGCHDSHSLEVKVESCKACHTGVATVEDLKKVRMAGSEEDYDGDGDVTEGIASEIEGLQGMLMTALQAYAKDVVGSAITYSPSAYPYFFVDTNGDGVAGDDEAVFANAYKSWTARLVKAAYNYEVAVKDPGAFAHGGKYIIELLYDSIEDLNTNLATPVDLSQANRIDAGHFAGSNEQFRHWDEGGVVSFDCAKCHSATGLPQFLDEASRARDKVTGQTVANPLSNGLACSTCHDDVSTFTRRVVDNVKFPSGAVLTFGERNDANLCIECHQGRESKVGVDTAIKNSGAADDEVSAKLSFRNPHYFAAGATLFGADAKGAYMYTGESYLGQNKHMEGFNTCVSCHDTHALKVKVEACSGCHTTVQSEEDLAGIRMGGEDYDGDGDTTEGLAGEIATLQEMLYTAIKAYAKDSVGAPLQYSAPKYPYFLGDPNENGQVDEGEEAYASWTPRLLRAAYNFQWVQKDPGAFAHNGKFIIQVLYDTLKDLGVDVTGLMRPVVPAE